MVGREVQEYPRGRIERRRKVDLVGGAFDNIIAFRRRRIERQDGRAYVSAQLRVAAAALQDMGDERRRRRLAVGPGNGDERAIGRMRPSLPDEKLDVADDLDAGPTGEIDAPVRLRMRQGNARRQHESRYLRPVDRSQVRRMHALGGRPGDAVRIVVPGRHLGAAGLQRMRGREPRSAEAEEGDLPAGEGGDRDHRALTAASASRGRAARARRR